MQAAIYFLVLVGMLFGYYELLGPGPNPSELVEDLEWWRPLGAAHTWEAFAGLERLAQEGGVGALVPLGLFWLPAVAMLVWGFRLFRSAVLRTVCTTAFFVLLILPYYGYMAERVWRFFEWRSPAVAATFAAVLAAGLFAPSLLRSALDRSRAWTALALAAVALAVFLLSTEITGTDSYMRLNISPWPVVTLFGLLLLGSVLATFHVAAGAGTWLGTRLGGTRGLALGALAAGVLAAALTRATLSAPRTGTLVATATIGLCYALVRLRLGSQRGTDAGRAGLVVLAAGLISLIMIHASNRIAIDFQKRARNETATQVLVALESFREKNGSYPRQLADLVPDFFPEVPRPQIGLIDNEDDEFTYRNLGDSYLLEFSSVQWVQCGYSPPFDVAKYSDEDYTDEDEDEEDAELDGEDVLEERETDPELDALLADQGLDGSWNCEDAPPKLW